MAREVGNLDVQGVAKAVAKAVVRVVGPVPEAVAGPVAAKAADRAVNRAKGTSLGAPEADREATKAVRAGRAGRAAALRSRVLARPPSTPSAPARTLMAARRAPGGPRVGSRTITTRSVSSFPWTRRKTIPLPPLVWVYWATPFSMLRRAIELGRRNGVYHLGLHTRSRRAAIWKLPALVYIV